MAGQDASEDIGMRKNFYQSSHRRVLIGLLFMILLNIVLSALLYYMVTNRPKPDYFLTMSDGKVVRMYSLSEPLVTNSELLQWATIAATSVYTYDFVDSAKALQAASRYFTPAGWQEFQNELKVTNILQTVISKKLTVRAVATGAPVILDRGPVNGVYKWKVQLPLLVTYQGVGSGRSNPMVITMMVTRVSTLDTPKGIQINAYYASLEPIQQPGEKSRAAAF